MRRQIRYLIPIAIIAVALGVVLGIEPAAAQGSAGSAAGSGTEAEGAGPNDAGPADGDDGDTASAYFAGGCFWCMEPPYDDVDGVLETISGYTGGTVENPSYRQVVAGGTGHLEAVRIVYDPDRVSYEELLYIFWRNIDPLDAGGQFCDRGESYTTAIFYANSEQRRLARESLREIRTEFDQSIATGIEELDEFYRAEEYHQNYYTKNPARYSFYRASCGRDARLRELWGEEGGTHSVPAES
jgi:peptide-methionine (S)-S-oxide reductase